MSPGLTLGLAIAGIGLIGLSAVISPPPRLVWNASASAPIGLYSVRLTRILSVGDLVVVRPPKLLERILIQRGYIRGRIPLIKRVAALPGQTVCRHGLLISVDGKPTGLAREWDHRGRPLPVWQGCRTLKCAEVFLMTADEPDSLDGRYFGPLPRSTVIGRAVPLWTRGAL